MRFPRTLLLFALSLPGLTIPAGVTLPASESTPASPAEIDRLVEQLGSSVFTEREAAAKKLEKLGAAALPGLRQALKSGDIETQRSAREIIETIERRAVSVNTLAPTKVHIQAKATPLPEVIRDLAWQSKIPLFLDCEPADLATRSITLDTGETSFWEALDALCRQAKVHLRPESQSLAPVGRQRQKSEKAARQEHQLVLQDGLLPEQPTAYLGCVRVRLLPDPFRDAKGGARGDQWILEVLSEPKLQWQERLFLSWQEPRGSQGKRVGSAPVIVEDAAKNTPEEDNAGINLGGLRLGGPGGGGVMVLQLNGQSGNDDQNKEPAVLRQEFPVKWTMPADSADKPITLQGKLKGGVLLPSAAVLVVENILKTEGKRFEGKDGSGLTVKKCERQADGTVKMEVVIEQSPQQAAKANQGNKLVMRIAGGAFGGGNVETPLFDGKTIGLYALDSKGRHYTVKASEASGENNILTYKLVLTPPAKDSELAKLERHAPYPAEVDQAFTLQIARPH